jgi:hypothetical protein
MSLSPTKVGSTGRRCRRRPRSCCRRGRRPSRGCQGPRRDIRRRRRRRHIKGVVVAADMAEAMHSETAAADPMPNPSVSMPSAAKLRAFTIVLPFATVIRRVYAGVVTLRRQAGFANRVFPYFSRFLRGSRDHMSSLFALAARGVWTLHTCSGWARKQDSRHRSGTVNKPVILPALRADHSLNVGLIAPP